MEDKNKITLEPMNNKGSSQIFQTKTKTIYCQQFLKQYPITTKLIIKTTNIYFKR